MAEMEFGLLGPLVVRRNGVVLAVPRGHERTVLATLLLDANRAVPVERLGEAVWGAEPPPSAGVTIRNLIRRLRHTLGDSGKTRVIAQSRGYLIRADASECDLARFEALAGSMREAVNAGCWDQAAALSRAALELWRGEPLAGVDSETLALQEVPRLAEMKWQTLETRIDADLRLGRNREVVAELRRLAATHPLREQVHAFLMLALYRCGRQGEAIAAYQHARAVLAEELGTEPGTGLQQLHQQILTGDPALATPALAAGITDPGQNAAVIPQQLPGGVAAFTGRIAELAALTEILKHADDHEPGTVAVAAIGGTAGVGKTALAVHWAHQAARHFPGGQLYVNLRGFGPSGTPATPAEAVRGFLAALGVPAGQVPHDLAAQAGLYRSLLAGRRMLILLDNAANEQQLRPLLPGTPGCLVLVTSRNQLTGLAATDGARLINLDVLPAADGRAMLTARLDAQRADAEPEAVTEITELCARLPLALAIAAARLTTSARAPLAALAAELRTATCRLNSLDTGDPPASIRAVFSWSTEQLTPAADRMFRQLGLHPGPDIAAPAAASLAGVPLSQAEQALSELTRASLLTEHQLGRYTFHDLLRAHAAEQAHTTDTENDRRAAIGRLLNHYLHTAHRAAMLLDARRDSITLPATLPGVTSERLEDSKDALGWFAGEYKVLLASVRLAAETGFDQCAWQLPWTMRHFQDWQGHWHDWAALQPLALAATTRLGDVAAQAVTSRLAASACDRLGADDQARTHLATALRLYRQLGDRVGEARAHQGLSVICDAQQRHAECLEHDEQALALFRAVGHRPGQAQILNAIGHGHIQLGNPQLGRTYCRQGLSLCRELGDRVGEAHAWDSLGFAEHQLGRNKQAAACYRRAISLHSDLGLRSMQAWTLNSLGDACNAIPDTQEAQHAWRQAVAILDELRHPGAEQVRAKLAMHPITERT